MSAMSVARACRKRVRHPVFGYFIKSDLEDFEMEVKKEFKKELKKERNGNKRSKVGMDKVGMDKMDMDKVVMDKVAMGKVVVDKEVENVFFQELRNQSFMQLPEMTRLCITDLNISVQLDQFVPWNRDVMVHTVKQLIRNNKKGKQKALLLTILNLNRTRDRGGGYEMVD